MVVLAERPRTTKAATTAAVQRKHHPVTRSGYTRVTLVGSARRVDVVLPDDEPVGRLLPEALRLTGERSASPAAERRLALLDGQLLDQDRTLSEASIPDGSVVHVVGLAEAPPPPVVLDVTEAAADDLDDRAWRWGPEGRRWMATAVATAATAEAFALTFRLDEASRPLLVLVSPVLLVAGALTGRFVSSAMGTTMVLCGTATGSYAATQLAGGTQPVLAWIGVVVAVTLVALGFGTALGLGGVIGGVAGLVLISCWTLALETLPNEQAATCMALVSAVLLGLLPRVAAVSSGLTGLDDRRSLDEMVTRTDVGKALRSAHRGLALACLAVAASALAAGASLAAAGGTWAAVLAALLATVVAIRIRAFPLVLEVVSLVIAALGIGYALLLAWLRTAESAQPAVVAVLVAVAGGSTLLTSARPSPQLRARLRVLSDRLEVAAVVAMVPVLVGVFGVYPRLLNSF
jgi:type VII secretion integral membrane protein EccD